MIVNGKQEKPKMLSREQFFRLCQMMTADKSAIEQSGKTINEVRDEYQDKMNARISDKAFHDAQSATGVVCKSNRVSPLGRMMRQQKVLLQLCKQLCSKLNIPFPAELDS